jgi:hypothetical protein
VAEHEISTKRALAAFLADLPVGSMTDTLSKDLETGNFDEAHFILPGGGTMTIRYRQRRSHHLEAATAEF